MKARSEVAWCVIQYSVFLWISKWELEPCSRTLPWMRRALHCCSVIYKTSSSKYSQKGWLEDLRQGQQSSPLLNPNVQAQTLYMYGCLFTIRLFLSEASFSQLCIYNRKYFTYLHLWKPEMTFPEPHLSLRQNQCSIYMHFVTISGNSAANFHNKEHQCDLQICPSFIFIYLLFFIF